MAQVRYKAEEFFKHPEEERGPALEMILESWLAAALRREEEL